MEESIHRLSIIDESISIQLVRREGEKKISREGFRNNSTLKSQTNNKSRFSARRGTALPKIFHPILLNIILPLMIFSPTYGPVLVF